MRTTKIAREGARALLGHRQQSFFMMAGTVVGIAALIVIMAIGRGTERKVMKRVNNFGPRAMMLISGGGRDLPPPDLTVTTLTLRDAEAVRESVEGLEIVTPMAWKPYTPVRHEENQIRSVVWGVEPEWHQAYNWYTDEGEGITAEDVATLARVCLIGQTLKEELFGGQSPIGGRVYLNRVALTVKGVLTETGTSPGGGDFDNKIILPITTAMRRVLNVDYLGAVRVITAEPSRMGEQAAQIRNIMRARHAITPPEEDDFRIVTAEIIADMARGISRTLFIMLLALAGISLLIGGVVMMNLMLISVTARTAEIGLRRALGASQMDIFVQFLTESLTVTLAGIIAGGLLGWAICGLLGAVTELPVIMAWQHYTVSMLFGLLVGVFFGVQPARRAARLHPVEALR